MKIDRNLWLIILLILSGRIMALPPQFITSPSIDTLFENIEFQKIIQARDPENDSFFFTFTLQPDGITDSLWNDSTLAVKWTPRLTDIGQHAVRVIVQDTTGLKDTLDLTWHVFIKNDPPFFVLNDIEVNIQQGAVFNRQFVYRDPDLDHNFTFTTLHKPSSMTINSAFSDSSILVNWQPANRNVGVDSLWFIIRDDSSASDTLRIRFVVSNRNDNPRFIPSEFTDTLSQGVSYQREIKVIDDDVGDNLHVTVIQKPDLMTIDFDYTDTTFLIKWTPINDQVGSNSLILQVYDDSLARDTLIGTFIVLNRNDPPLPGSIVYPISGQVLTDRLLSCWMTKGSDPDTPDSLLSYRFLLFYDPTDSPGVAGEWSSPWILATGDTIEYTFPDSLNEDSYYYLMAQVRDDSLAIADYDSVRFFVNTSNQLPSFDYYTPAEGAIIPTRSPRFTVTEATDSDDSVFYYSFIIMNGIGSEMLDSAYNRSSNQYTTDEILLENGKFLWSARVQDESGGYTDWKPLRSFYVNSLEEAPYPPQKFWIYGMDSVSHYISVSNPTFTWEIPSLPDPDPLTQKGDIRFRLQIYSDTNSFPIYQVNSDKGGTYYFFSEGELIERVKYYARITAIDPTGLYSTPSSYLYFYIDLENNKPVILTEPDTVAYEDQEYRYILKVFDDEMDRVRISFVQNPEGMGLDSSQIHYVMDTLYAPIIWVPSAVQLGTHRVRLNIWDQMDRVVIQEYDLDVYNTNDPPEIIRPPRDTLYNIRVGDSYTVELECRDQDGIDSIRFTFLSKPDWLKLGAYTHQLTDYSLILQGTPSESAIGVNRVVFRVVDDSGDVDLDSFRIAVHNQNLPPGIPELLFPANRSRVTTTKRPTLICKTTTDPDPEDSILTYSFEIASDSLFTNIVTYITHVQASQGQVQWTIQMDLTENMVYYWRVRAFDSFSLAGEYSSFFRFMINTVDDPPSLAPEILYPRSYQIFHSPDSIIFRFRNPSDPDTPVDSLRGYMFISMRQNGTILYKNDNLKFNWAGNYTEVNLSEFFQQNAATVENQWMFWRVLVQDNSFGQASSKLDTFAVSFTDEVPNPIQLFVTRKDEVGYQFGEGKLETNNNYVYFQWTPPVPPSPDPEDSITNISYKISIYHAGSELTLVDSLFTKVDARSIYSHEDNNLVSGSFLLTDNIRYRAGIQAMDKNGRLSAMTFGSYFLYNERNDSPYPLTILEIEDMDINHILRDTRLTLIFETPGDPDYTDSIPSLVYFLDVASDSFFSSIVYSDSLTYAQIKPGIVTSSAVRFTHQLQQDLENYQVYYLRIRSRDDELLFSDWSNRVWVEIQAGNRPPEKPEIIYPESDQEITDTDLPLMRIRQAFDPDGQTLHYFFRLYEALTATYSDSSGSILDTTWSSAFLLSENYHYRLSVRAFDGQLYSPYDSVDFYINQDIEPPTVPLSFRIKDLKNGILSNKLPTYTWQSSWDADPFDLANIYYRIGLFSSEDTSSALWQSSPITEIRYLTPESDSLAEDSSYWARIRARVDKNQQQSAWSEPVYFKINTQNQSPHVELQGALTEENQVFKGIIEIRWIAYDQDEDSLSVSLEYSGDYGNSWTLLPLTDIREDSMRINDSLYLWNCNDAYTQYGEKNSRIRISVSDGTTPVSVVSPSFTIARSSGPQPKVFSPDHEQTRINFTMEESGNVSIRIYNMARKLVRRLVTDLYCQTGDHYVEWNGLDDHGSILPNRIYFIVLEKPNGKREYSSVVIMRK